MGEKWNKFVDVSLKDEMLQDEYTSCSYSIAYHESYIGIIQETLYLKDCEIESYTHSYYCLHIYMRYQELHTIKSVYDC